MHIAPQNTFGRGRVAIQNRLVAKGLAKLIDDDALCALTDQGTAIAIAIRGEKR
jgi:helix-turn-helix protein